MHCCVDAVINFSFGGVSGWLSPALTGSNLNIQRYLRLNHLVEMNVLLDNHNFASFEVVFVETRDFNKTDDEFATPTLSTHRALCVTIQSC